MVTRISTMQMYQKGIKGMQARQRDVMKFQQQVITNKKIITPSDDPVTAAKLDLMRQRVDGAIKNQENNVSARSALSFEETILTNAVQITQRIQELQVRAFNSTLSQTERDTIALEMEDLLNQLQGVANAQDSNGFYIFSGSKSLSEAITKNASGQFVYNGDETIRKQVISNGIDIQLSDSGAKVFMNIRNGNGEFSVEQPSTLNTGSAFITAGSVVDFSSYVKDNYTIQFVNNSQGKLVYMVSGTLSGNVLPPTGLPDDAPLYVAGQAISVNGLSVTVEGLPDVGDGFLMNPSKNTSIFDTIQRGINALKVNLSSDQLKANFKIEASQVSAQLKNSMDNIIDVIASIGTRLNTTDVAESINEDLKFSSIKTISSLEDANPEEAYSSFQLNLVYLQAAQMSFSKIQGLSIFNYL